MTQQELYEFVCKHSSNVSIFETPPSENYICGICNYQPPEKEHNSKFSKNHMITIPPRYWRCGNHHQTFKWNDSCPECSIKFTKRNFPTADWVQLPNKNDEKTLNEIEMSKTGVMMRNKVKENLIALKQAQLDTPVLLKQLIGKMDKLTKVMKEKNEVRS